MKSTLRLVLTLVLLLAPQMGCGVAQRAGRGAAEGAMGALAGKMGGDRQRLEELTEGVKRRALGGALEELGQPERLDEIQRISAAIGAGAVRGAARAASGGPESIAGQTTRALSEGIAAELGPAGEGPLAASLSATTEQMTASMARGAQNELAPLFPECRGADAASCVDRVIERVSRASAAGVAAGIRQSLGIAPLVMAFGAGAISMLAIAWAWAIYRAGRPARG